jgi:hypothetical protein
MILIGGNRSTERKAYISAKFVHQKSHIVWPGIEYASRFYRAVNTLHLGYKNPSATAVERH